MTVDGTGILIAPALGFCGLFRQECAPSADAPTPIGSVFTFAVNWPRSTTYACIRAPASPESVRGFHRTSMT